MKQADSSLSFPLLMKALERCVPRGSTLSIHSPVWKSSHIWRYKDILFFLGGGKFAERHINFGDFCDILNILVGEVNK